MSPSCRPLFTSIAAVASIVVPATAGSIDAPRALVASTLIAQSGGLKSLGQLTQLLEPIALFPDPLLAQTLAASNYPSQVVQAHDWWRAGGRAYDNPSTQFPASVGFFMNLPDLLASLASHSDWLGIVGRAYGAQPADLMNAIQVLRKRARDAGNLVSNDAWTIIVDGNVILIEPANSQFIPVPTYERDRVFSSGEGRGNPSQIQFKASVPTSAVTQRLDCDWRAGRITYGWGGWYRGDLGQSNAGGSSRPSASGTYTVIGNGPGYDGSGWRPNGTIVEPGSRSTQGQALQWATPLPLVEPTAPLMPATPVQALHPIAPVQRLSPRAPVQALSARAPLRPIAPVQPIPSNIAYQPPVPFGGGDGIEGTAWTPTGTAFGVGSGGYAAGARGAASYGGTRQ